MMNKEMNENKEVCAMCGGDCCKSYPGTYVPEDLFDDLDNINHDTLVAIIDKYNLAIDKWDGDEDSEYVDVYFLRPKTERATGIVDYMFGGTCHHLQDYGCELLFDKRPTQCRNLTPKDENCHYCYDPELVDSEFVGKLYYALKWKPYQDILKELSEELSVDDDANDLFDILLDMLHYCK